MKKAFIGIGGICAYLCVSLADLEVYISIPCIIIICIATLIATFKKSKSKTSKEIEVTQDNNAEDRENNTSVEQSSNNNNNQVELEQQIIQTAHNIQELLNKRKGGDNNG